MRVTHSPPNRKIRRVIEFSGNQQAEPVHPLLGAIPAADSQR